HISVQDELSGTPTL
nr:immunoglobulin heavy chain junction region [Mus musculus]